MSASEHPVEVRRELVSTFTLSDHVHFRLRYDKDKRCITKQVISDAILDGDRGDNPGGKGDTAIHYTVAGITFKIVVDTLKERVVTAYPVEINRVEAITSNRWSQTQINSIEERVEAGKTKML